MKLVLINHEDDVYEDEIAEELSKRYNLKSYGGIKTIPEEYRQFDPWLMAGKFYKGVIGMTRGQRRNFIMPTCPNINYFQEVQKGLLRLVEPKTGTFSGPATGGFDNRIYFPTELLLDKVLKKV